MDYLCQVLNEDGDTFLSEAEHLKQAIQDCCYDEKDGLFYSCDLNLRPINKNEWLHSGHPRHWSTLIQRIGCWASFLPLWAGIATKAQAERMVKENLLDPRTFCSPWGVRSLAKTEKMFDVYEGGNPSCWLGAIWGISNYLVFRGLVDYGFEVEARSLAEKTVTLFGRDLEETGTLHEYYNDETGAPVIHPGFQNWNLLSLNMIAWLEGREVVREF